MRWHIDNYTSLIYVFSLFPVRSVLLTVYWPSFYSYLFRNNGILSLSFIWLVRSHFLITFSHPFQFQWWYSMLRSLLVRVVVDSSTYFVSNLLTCVREPISISVFQPRSNVSVNLIFHFILRQNIGFEDVLPQYKFYNEILFILVSVWPPRYSLPMILTDPHSIIHRITRLSLLFP